MTYPFKQAAHYRRGRLRSARVLGVVHDMEVVDAATTAENVAGIFASATSRDASAHFCVDRDSVVQCVKMADTAFAAPGANADGFHIEHAGFARQSHDEWLHDPVLNLSSAVAADVVVSYRRGVSRLAIPLRRLSVPEIVAGNVSGFAGHIDITNAYHKSDHSDPGPSFPWADWFAKVDWWCGQLDKPGYAPRYR